MPWKHCEHKFILDDEDCPTCGISKEAWTLEIDQTRLFQISRKKKPLVLELRDGARPIPGEPYRVTLPDGRVLEGKLDEKAQVEVGAAAGKEPVRAEFPQRSAVFQIAPSVEARGAGRVVPNAERIAVLQLFDSVSQAMILAIAQAQSAAFCET
jgi:hypothetical protein